MRSVLHNYSDLPIPCPPNSLTMDPQEDLLDDFEAEENREIDSNFGDMSQKRHK